MATKQNKKLNTLYPFLFAALLFLVWELAARIFSIPTYILPAPSIIAIFTLQNINSLLPHILITTEEALLGFLLATFLGIAIAISLAYSKILEKSAYPFIVLLQTMPIIVISPLLILWMGNGIASKIAIVSITAIFPVIINTTKGLNSVDQETADLFRSLSASTWQIFTKLRFPTALPYIFSALKISTSLSVIGAIVGEFVGANQGLGFLILISSYSLGTVKMFSAVLFAALIGIIFLIAVSVIEKKVVFWVDEQK